MTNHQDKIRLARKLRTKDEEARGVSIFRTKAWENRTEAIRGRVKNTETKMKKASLEAKKRKSKLIKGEHEIRRSNKKN